MNPGARILLLEDDPAMAGEATDRTVDPRAETLRAKLRAMRPAPEPIAPHRGMSHSLELSR